MFRKYKDCPFVVSPDGISSPATGCYCGIHLDNKGKPQYKCDCKNSCKVWQVIDDLDKQLTDCQQCD